MKLSADLDREYVDRERVLLTLYPSLVDGAGKELLYVGCSPQRQDYLGIHVIAEKLSRRKSKGFGCRLKKYKHIEERIFSKTLCFVHILTLNMPTTAWL